MATYEAVAPDYQKYVKADSALSEEAKQRRLDLIDSWKKRIDEAKK